MKTKTSRTGSQLELALSAPGKPAGSRGDPPAPQLRMAEWWFARMREVVENSPRWTPGPEAMEFHPLEASRKLVLVD